MKKMSKKKVSHPREDVSRRLRVASGHLNKIIEMVDTGIYCVDILQQTAAVKSSIKKAEEILLVNHLNHCVIDAMKSPKTSSETIAELGTLFRKI